MSKDDPKLIHIIGDYGTGDLAFEEVALKIISLRPHFQDQVRTISVDPFDTYATGFVLAQLALNSTLGERHKFFVNTAPRKDDLAARANNAGEAFAYLKLRNGVEIGAVNSGYSLSLVKAAAEEICAVNCSVDGTQFRSRDVFPEPFVETAINGNRDLLGQRIDPSDIPDMPDNVILYTDGYGNLKTSISPDTLADRFGQEAQVGIGNWSKPALISKGIFGVKDGELCLSKGSSGWKLEGLTSRDFSEVVERGGSASRQFSKPRGGSILVVDGFTPKRR